MKLGHAVLVVLLSGALAIPISAALARIGIIRKRLPGGSLAYDGDLAEATRSASIQSPTTSRRTGSGKEP